MRFRTLHALVAVALVAGCASRQPAPATPAPPPEQPPIKAQEVPLAQRAQIRTDLAAGYYERGQFAVALEELAEAQKLDPNQPRIYNIYGLVYTMMNEPQKAEENFRRAVTMAPNDSEIRHNWGAYLCGTGRTREGLVELDQVIRDPLYKTPEKALINAGKCAMALGDNARADQYLRQAMTLSPNNPTAAYTLALLAFRQSRLDDARAWMRPVMQQQTPPPEALYLGMCIERKQGDRQAELSYTSQLRNRYPESPEAKALPGGACE